MIKLYKKIGETPLEALKRLRRQRPELKDERLSYAGRLDPMACGILPILVGEENDNRRQYLGADKSYVFTVLFGVGTDTFDLLGLPSFRAIRADKNKETQNREQEVSPKELFFVNSKNFLLTKSKLQTVADSLEGKQVMRYPPYSSKTVELDGKKTPLWQVARSGRLQEVDLPTHEIAIYNLDISEIGWMPLSYLSSYIQHYVGKVDGDFRQEQIIAQWQTLLRNTAIHQLPEATFRIGCSAGTYVRRLAQMMGEKLDTEACVFRIIRTGVDHD